MNIAHVYSGDITFDHNQGQERRDLGRVFSNATAGAGTGLPLKFIAFKHPHNGELFDVNIFRDNIVEGLARLGAKIRDVLKPDQTLDDLWIGAGLIDLVVPDPVHTLDQPYGTKFTVNPDTGRLVTLACSWDFEKNIPYSVRGFDEGFLPVPDSRIDGDAVLRMLAQFLRDEGPLGLY